MNAQCAREALSDHGFGACSPPASTPPCTDWRPACTPSPPTPANGNGCGNGRSCPDRVRRGGPPAVPGADLLPHRHDRRHPRRHGRPGGHEDPHVPGRGQSDPDRWHDPDRFDLTLDPSGHVGFGMGIHQCIGQHVARLEAEAPLTALAVRVERIELTGTPHRHPNNTLRSWASLPVRVHGARRDTARPTSS
ncbi:cytochrome P450 [Streptomyces canus]|uniref:cytochrome P450 n=1 Tax=Streptomyces canus TaxID=58343 RepID=UPI0033A7F5AC